MSHTSLIINIFTLLDISFHTSSSVSQTSYSWQLWARSASASKLFLNKKQRNKKFFLEKNFFFVFEMEILEIESDNEE
jgi:hypothetical protein